MDSPEGMALNRLVAGIHLGEVRLLITPYKPKAQCGAAQQHVTCVPKGRDNKENSYGVLRGWNKGLLLRAKPYGLSCSDQIPQRGWHSIGQLLVFTSER